MMPLSFKDAAFKREMQKHWNPGRKNPPKDLETIGEIVGKDEKTILKSYKKDYDKAKKLYRSKDTLEKRKFMELHDIQVQLPKNWVVTRDETGEIITYGGYKWFEETYNKDEIENLITVGGESRNITYPGPSVNEALEAIKQNLTLDVLCGGISIPSREKESRKLIEKSKNGSEFFTTQVLYDSSKIIKMISHYQKRCDEQNTFPRRLLLSFAPVSSKKNIKFLKWLGVDIPTDTEKYLNENDQIMTERSMEIAINVLNETLTFLNENKIVVPIGLNVEHIMSYNFQASIEMLQELARIYREFCIKTDIY